MANLPIPVGRSLPRTVGRSVNPVFLENLYRGQSDARVEEFLRYGLNPQGRARTTAELERAFTPRLWSRQAWTRGEATLRWRKAMGGAGMGIGVALNLAFAPAMIGGSALTEAANWGTKTGFKEDYIGGAVFGMRQGVKRSVGMMIGEAVGVTAGAFFGGVGTFVGGIAGAYAGDVLGEFFGRRGSYESGRMASIRATGAIAKRKVQFGRGFRDTEEAYTMRQMAVQEMAGSLLNARQYLGNEAYFMHR